MKSIKKSREQMCLYALKFIFIFSAVILLFSCEDGSKQSPGDPDVSKNNTNINDLLQRRDFDLKKVEYYNDYIIYDKDLVIFKNDIINSENACVESSNAKVTQAVLNADGIVSWSKMGSLTFRIDQGILNLGADWQNAIRQAVSDWANVGQDNINFTETTGAADITFFADNASAPACLQNLPATVGGRAIFSSGGNPGAAVSVNADLAISNADRVYIIKHELGHSFGFRHTDWHNRGGTGESEGFDGQANCSYIYGANRLYRTPNTDANSVFNAFLPFAPGGFTNDDIRSIRMLYPSSLSYPGIASATRVLPNVYSWNVFLNNLDDRTTHIAIYTEVFHPTPQGGFYTLDYVSRHPVFDDSRIFFPVPNSGSTRRIKFRATNFKGDFVSSLSPNYYQLP